jgi:hypothetical protein
MSRKVEPQANAKDKVYYAQKADKPNITSSLAGATFGYIAILGIVYGVVSFSRPELIEEAFQKKWALFLIVFGLGVFLVSLAGSLSVLGRATFEKVSTAGARITFPSSFSSLAKVLLQLSGVAVVDEISGYGDRGQTKTEPLELQADRFTYGVDLPESSFESFISNVLRSLSAYATSSEITATKLLDKGVAFMAGGLVFYIVAIIVWQVFANLTNPDSYMMYIGMAACSMTFLVVEFLAAWFFKQYRYYVEVSLSCLRVRSVYDRYLLNYYALREFEGKDDEKIRKQMMEVLKEDVSWPDYKKGVDNDFNYMIESMSAAHTSLDKMKDLFQPKKKAAEKPKSKPKTKAEEV